MLINLLIGALAGWIAGKIMKSKTGFWINLALGILGGLVGGVIFGFLGIYSFAPLMSTIYRFISSVVGACLIVWVYNKLIKKD